MLENVRMQISIWAFVFALLAISPAIAADRITWPSSLPVYDHIVIVIEENKDVEQILSLNSGAPYMRKLAAEGAVMSRMFGEEHYSQGNYFWLFSASNQNVGFADQVPSRANHPEYQAGGLLRRQRHNARQHPAQHRGNAWLGKIRQPATKRRRRRHFR